MQNALIFWDRFNWKFLIQCLALVFCLDACKSKTTEEVVVEKCSSCHMFPEPSLLNKKSWDEHVLPQMAFRMGWQFSLLAKVPKNDRDIVLAHLPNSSMVTQEEWDIIKEYYHTNSPDSLSPINAAIRDSITEFDIVRKKLPIGGSPFSTLLQIDSATGNIYYGNKYSMLYKLSRDLSVTDSLRLNAPPSHIAPMQGKNFLVSTMGNMNPNDQRQGKISVVNFETREAQLVIDSLKRPVHFETADLNGDQLNDLIVCSFGNFTGDLTIYEQTSGYNYIPHTIQSLPGARKVIVRDFDGDGRKDILAMMTQGDEKIIQFQNKGNFNFEPKTLLRFPPVYGSCYFDIADFNRDGHFDLLYVNGDNADYSPVLKPYHGVRIFINDGKNNFSETFFFPLHGAFEAIAHDFDVDGDLDIAAIAFFPNFKSLPEQGFVYLENNGKSFTPKVTRMGATGRWLVMEHIDLDRDNDEDIILGAFNLPLNMDQNLFRKWTNDPVDLLVLYNKKY